MLSYGAEIWGFHKGQKVKKVRKNFCKRVWVSEKIHAKVHYITLDIIYARMCDVFIQKVV